MGIYDSGYFYGIKIYNFNNGDFANVLYEKRYHKIMTDEEKKEAYAFYVNLSDKTDIHFQYYTECSSSYGTKREEPFFMWHPMALASFLDKFGCP
jgi:hypothetical protein